MKTKYVAVIGLGTFGSTVARTLAGFGDRVLGIDIDENRASRLADELTEVVIADGRDEEALREAGVEGYDTAVVAIGEDLEANILCTMNVKLLGVKSVWAKSLNETHHRILHKIGVERVIHPEEDIGHHIAQVLHNPLMRDYLSLGNGFYIVDVQVPERLDGHALKDAKLAKYEVRCLGLMRETSLLEQNDSESTLRGGDKLLLLGRRRNLQRFGDTL